MSNEPIAVEPDSQLCLLIADRVPIQAHSPEEAVAVLKNAMRDYYSIHAKEASMRGDYTRDGKCFHDMPRQEHDLRYPVLGIRVSAINVVLVHVVCESQEEWRRRESIPPIEPPSGVSESIKQHSMLADYEAARYLREMQISHFEVLFSPSLTHNAPLFAGTKFTEQGLVEAIRGNVSHGYVWCHAPSCTEDSDGDQ